ncbi:MAG: hypothetical protein IKN55_03320 [Oscillospiraceae bacterium]|nr:hypothetical protein [Oscillospiraceae bacterium]
MDDNKAKVSLNKDDITQTPGTTPAPAPATGVTPAAPSKQKRHVSIKAIGLVILIAAVIGLAIFGVLKLMQWRNNGARFAEALSEQIGVSPETAQKYAHITLQNASEFACVNQAAEQYKYLYESQRTVTVSGVKIPQWVIYVGEKNDTVTDIQYYDYAQLQKYGSGVKTNAHVDASGIINGMDPAAVQTYVGFKPLRIVYTNKSMEESYKYYYKDANTGNTVSYILHVTYEDNLAVNVTEEENQFILNVLMLPQ